MEDYRIIFSGETKEGQEVEIVKARLSELFGLNKPELAEGLFSGKDIAIRRNLSAEQARELQQAIDAAGGRCRVEPPLEDAAEPSPDDPIEFTGLTLDPEEPAAPAPEAPATPEVAATETIAMEEPAPAKQEAPSLSGLSLVPIEEDEKPAQEAEAAEEPGGLSLAPIEGEEKPGAELEPAAAEDTPSPAPEEEPEPVVTGIVPTRVKRKTSPEPLPEQADPDPEVDANGRVLNAGQVNPRADSAVAMSQEENTSGRGSGTHVPEEVRGLSWGGFFLNWIWGVGNGTYIALLALVPVFGIAVPFYLLFKGRELAWQNTTWRDTEHFNHVQRRWAQVGLGLTALILFLYFQAVSSVHSNMEAIAAEPIDQARCEEMFPKIKDKKQRDFMCQIQAAADRAQKEREARQAQQE